MNTASIIVIIPANNEAGYIDACLQSVLEQVDCGPMHVVVSANACSDDTVSRAQAWSEMFSERGHVLTCLDSPEAGKLGALNRAEEFVKANGLAALPYLYLDADITCHKALIGQISLALETDTALYATGTLQVKAARTLFTRLYARFWQTLPFVQSGAVGAGCFAVNAAGRARWDDFPNIISDDTFVRLNFTPDERIEVPATYEWPMIEGFSRLVRVRRRQDAGVAELAELYPDLLQNEGKAQLTRNGIVSRALRMPLSFLAYMSVHFGVRFAKGSGEWSRGR